MGGKSRPLHYQFLNAIDVQFGGGGKNKHSIKREAQGKGVTKPLDNVYGYKDREGLVQFSHQLGEYVKEKYPNIKLVKDIKSDQIQEFLKYKAETVSQASLETYTSYGRKLGRIINTVYNAKTKWEKEIAQPVSLKTTNKIRDIAMSEEDYTKVEDLSLNSRSKAKYSIPIAKNFGLRVEELSSLQRRDIRLEENILHVHEGKGGKNRDIRYDPNSDKGKFIIKVAQEAGNDPYKRIIPLKPGSINKHLERMEEKAGIREKYKEKNTSIHAIRKLCAQQHYDECRKSGMSISQSLSNTSVFLGHGDDRDEIDDVIRAYVLNVW